MREIVLHDTLSGELLPLRPRDPGRVGIYACGPTVYSRIHIGNARPFVVFSLLKRFLEHEGYDVDAGREHHRRQRQDLRRRASIESAHPRPSAELAEEMTGHYLADTDALGLGRPDHEPLASETIGAIVEYIQTLIVGRHAYAVDGDVYFRVRSDTGYGSLSHRQLDEHGSGRRRGNRARWPARRTRSTSRCGRRTSRARTPAGRRRGAWAGRAGTSSARRWLSSTWASASTSTAAALT